MRADVAVVQVSILPGSIKFRQKCRVNEAANQEEIDWQKIRLFDWEKLWRKGAIRRSIDCELKYVSYINYFELFDSLYNTALCYAGLYPTNQQQCEKNM